MSTGTEIPFFQVFLSNMYIDVPVYFVNTASKFIAVVNMIGLLKLHLLFLRLGRLFTLSSRSMFDGYTTFLHIYYHSILWRVLYFDIKAVVNIPRFSYFISLSDFMEQLLMRLYRTVLVDAIFRFFIVFSSSKLMKKLSK